VSVLPRSNFFSTAAPAEASRTGHRDQKRANRAPSDSHRNARSPVAMCQSEAFGVRSRNTLRHNTPLTRHSVQCIKVRVCS
jgi:hypothetical protein